MKKHRGFQAKMYFQCQKSEAGGNRKIKYLYNESEPIGLYHWGIVLD